MAPSESVVLAIGNIVPNICSTAQFGLGVTEAGFTLTVDAANILTSVMSARKSVEVSEGRLGRKRDEIVYTFRVPAASHC